MMFLEKKFISLLRLFVFALLVSTPSLQAKTIILIHGYLADGISWHTTGVTKGLIQAGWKDGGSYRYGAQGMLIPHSPWIKNNAFFTVDLPSKASIEIQTNYLSQYLEHLYRLRKEPFIFIGHSAGGIVARYYLIHPTHVPARALITIGSPHLGTPAADLALLASNSPLGIMLEMAGQDMRDSRGLFSDLKEAKPATFLYWLNQQPHPRIPYVSVIRSNKLKRKANKYDFVVPSESQNMNNIEGLRGKSWAYLTQENHFLNAKDGAFLVDILKRIKTGKKR
jgi:triacylglycerol esterase/lipase EstA (alpha/beta hydrolase family)